MQEHGETKFYDAVYCSLFSFVSTIFSAVTGRLDLKDLLRMRQQHT